MAYGRMRPVPAVDGCPSGWLVEPSTACRAPAVRARRESVICAQALGVGAGEAGAWAGGHAAGAALGAFVGLVARDI